MEEYILIIRIEVNGIVQDKITHHMSFEEATGFAKRKLEIFTDNDAKVYSCKIYKVKQIEFPNQI